LTPARAVCGATGPNATAAPARHHWAVVGEQHGVVVGGQIPHRLGQAGAAGVTWLDLSSSKAGQQNVSLCV